MYVLTRPTIYVIIALAAVALTVSASTTAPVYAAHHSHESSESALMKAIGGQPSGYENGINPVADQTNGPIMAADQAYGNGNNPVADQAYGNGNNPVADQAYGNGNNPVADQAYGNGNNPVADQAYGNGNNPVADQAYGNGNNPVADQAYGNNPAVDQMNGGSSSGYSGPTSMHADYHHHHGHVSTLGVVANAW
jgi:hypothetical protein